MADHRMVAVVLGMCGIAASAVGAVVHRNKAQITQMTVDHAATLHCLRVAHEHAIEMVIHDLSNTIGRAQNVMGLTLMQGQEEGYTPELTQSAWDAMHEVNTTYHRKVDAIRDAVQLYHGTLQLQPASTDIGQLVEDVRRALCAYYRDESYRVCVDVDEPTDEVWVWCDAARIQRVLFTLMSHAVLSSRGMANDAQIAVQIGAEPTHVRITIKDNGMGLTAQALQHITQMPQTTIDTGIPFCAQLLQKGDGTLTVTSPGPEQGTTVTVVLSRRTR